MTFIYFFLIALAVVPSQIFAEIPGTARSNERDLLRLDVNAGLTAPSTGLSAGGTVLWTLRPAHAVGLSTSVATLKSSKGGVRFTLQAYDIVWEHSIALMEGFHALRFRGGLGASNVSRSISVADARLKNEPVNRQIWAGHGLISTAVDIPMADLMWVRLGLWGEKSFLESMPAHGGVFVGWVFGGQWLGVGD